MEVHQLDIRYQDLEQPKQAAFRRTGTGNNIEGLVATMLNGDREQMA